MRHVLDNPACDALNGPHANVAVRLVLPGTVF